MIKRLQIVSLAILSFFVIISTAQASGSTTGLSSGTVGVVQDGNTLYLSTTATNSGTTTMSSNAFGQVIIYKGYALTLGGLITSVLTIVMLVAALITLLQLITAAFSWLSSGGDQGKITDARGKIMHAIIGLVIIAASWAIFLLVIRFLGFESFDDLLQNVKPISGV